MKKILLTLGIGVGIILIYIIIINASYSIRFSEITGSEQEETSRSYSMVKIGVSDKVEVSVTRHRWYGTIKESGSTIYLYLFNKIRLPFEKGHKISHSIILALFTIALIIAIILDLNDRRKKRWHNIGHYEQHG